GGAPLERIALAKSPTLQEVRNAGVVLVREEDFTFLVNHSKRALRVIRQNVAIALATKVAFLISAVLGASPLWLAVLADTGATVLVTLNGLRLLRA
ncbi:MAG TPA: heavy metal translocating P-type ATPase, partial [Vicinamibacterales bacterium]|nr:heavy metal translocating P-type ATPase [Vicinamibacterales bacterium]